MGNRSFFNALHDREGDFLLATVLEGPAQGERVLLRNTAPVWPEELPAFWGEHLPALAAVTSSGILESAGHRIFVERFGAAPQLVVCGGGHVGASVVRLAKLLGLPVTALEDRPEFAEELRQAGADAVLCLPFAEGLAQISGGQETYFVVVTRAHSCDIACLRFILQKPAAYVGMMGSRKRAALVHTQLVELGLPQERIDALHAPIGLSIGAKTAQEIALSILAEIVSVKNSRQQTEGFSPALLAALEQQTAPVVLEMFTKYSEGATMQELVNLLNSRGMRSIRGGKITLNIMNHLLKNRRYMGEYSYRDVVKENGIPAIVPKELFERVQERLAKNKKAPARHKAEDDYLLTTKLYCGKCGSFMVGESGTSHTMKVHRYYRCVNTKKKKLCDKKAVKKDWIEDLVVNYTMKAIMNDEVMERLIDTLMELQKKESTDLPLLKKQLAETEKGINNMLNAIQAGIFTPSTKQRLDELEETKSQLEVSILQEEMHKPLLTREQIAFFIYRFRKFDVTKREQRQRLIDSFVNAVYLYEDKIILTFNYKDGSKTITLAEVEGSDLSVLGAPRAEDLRRRSSALFFERAKENPDIKIVVVWPGQYRSEAFLCDPTVALEKIR